jgi:hypothetical protein
MPLIKRQSKGVTRSSMIIAIALHVLLFWIFWQAGGDEIIKDFIADVTSGKHGPPPPPPKKAPPQVKMTAPPKVEPKFKVETPKVAPSVKPVFGSSVIPSMDVKMPEPDYTQMAMEFGTVSIAEDKGATFSIAAVDVMGKMGLDLTKKADKFKKVAVTGSKKRTRGRFTWTMARYNSNYWDQFVKNGGVKNLTYYINNETFLKMDSNSRTINLESSFSFWLKQAKETITSKERVEKTPESELLDELARAAYELTRPELNKEQKYIDLLQEIIDNYFFRKYEFHIKGRAAADVQKDAEKKSFEAWRQEGLKEVLTTLEKLPAIKKYVDGTELQPLWKFAKKAEILECPIISFRGGAGVASINDEMVEILHTYINNGGFIYIDDGSQDDDYKENRNFIHKVTGQILMDDVAKQQFKRLAQDDKSVPGYDLLGNDPEPFHPYTYIQFSIPEQSRVYIRIFNKLGLLIREYDLGELMSGSYADRKSALKWDCKDQKGQDVGSGVYFCQMEAGLFKETRQITVDNLRYLDNTNPLYSAYERFDNVPMGYMPIGYRPYGNAAFGYYVGDHLAIVYNEGNEVTSGMGDSYNAAKKESCGKWLTNIIVFALTQPTGIAARQ